MLGHTIIEITQARAIPVVTRSKRCPDPLTPEALPRAGSHRVMAFTCTPRRFMRTYVPTYLKAMPREWSMRYLQTSKSMCTRPRLLEATVLENHRNGRNTAMRL